MKRGVSRFALSVVAFVFVCFVLFLLGVAAGRDLLNVGLGPFTAGVWLLLLIHTVPVVLGIVHMKRADR